MSTPLPSEWIASREAVAILKPVLSEYQAQLRICERAHAGLVRTRAKHFHHGNTVYQNHDVPKGFWWAEGHEALKQDWVVGDFSTWINNQVQMKALG